MLTSLLEAHITSLLGRTCAVGRPQHDVGRDQGRPAPGLAPDEEGGVLLAVGRCSSDNVLLGVVFFFDNSRLLLFPVKGQNVCRRIVAQGVVVLVVRIFQGFDVWQ
jgi:hypothetical protein